MATTTHVWKSIELNATARASLLTQNLTENVPCWTLQCQTLRWRDLDLNRYTAMNTMCICYATSRNDERHVTAFGPIIIARVVGSCKTIAYRLYARHGPKTHAWTCRIEKSMLTLSEAPSDNDTDGTSRQRWTRQTDRLDVGVERQLSGKSYYCDVPVVTGALYESLVHNVRDVSEALYRGIRHVLCTTQRHFHCCSLDRDQDLRTTRWDDMTGQVGSRRPNITDITCCSAYMRRDA